MKQTYLPFLFVNQGLSSCKNLKWISVAQNELKSLHGVETLIHLSVSTWPFLWLDLDLNQTILESLTISLKYTNI